MKSVKTTRLREDDAYEIEIPPDFISKLGWRNGTILEIKLQNDHLVIEKLHGFMGS